MGPLVTTVIERGTGCKVELTVIGPDGVTALDIATVIVFAAAPGASTAATRREKNKQALRCLCFLHGRLTRLGKGRRRRSVSASCRAVAGSLRSPAARTAWQAPGVRIAARPPSRTARPQTEPSPAAPKNFGLRTV